MAATVKTDTPGVYKRGSKATANRVTGHLKLIERREGLVWYAKTRVPGRTPEQTTRRLAPAHLAGGKSPAGSLTRRQARDALADLLAQERRNVGEGAYDHQPDGATFADAAAGFLRHVEHVKGREFSTVKDYRLSVERYLNPRWGDRPVRAITPVDVAKLRDECMAQGLSARTVVRHLTVAHGVFKHAVREHGLARNPASAELVERPPVRYTGGFDTFDADELAALARAADAAQDATLFLTAAMTGLRQGEPSAAWPCARSRSATCRRCSAMRTSRRRCATSITSGRRRRRAWSGAFAGDSVSPLVSRTGDIGGNSAQLSDTESPSES